MRRSSARFRRSASVVSLDIDDGTLSTVVSDYNDDSNNLEIDVDLHRADRDTLASADADDNNNDATEPKVADNANSDSDSAVNDATAPQQLLSGAAASDFSGVLIYGPPEAVQAVRSIVDEILGTDLS